VQVRHAHGLAHHGVPHVQARAAPGRRREQRARVLCDVRVQPRRCGLRGAPRVWRFLRSTTVGARRGDGQEQEEGSATGRWTAAVPQADPRRADPSDAVCTTTMSFAPLRIRAALSCNSSARSLVACTLGVALSTSIRAPARALHTGASSILSVGFTPHAWCHRWSVVSPSLAEFVGLHRSQE
jgi:hypothetical protein